MRTKIVASGLYVPARVETAEELAPRLGVSATWIVERTGVLRRHVADEPIECMGAKAARRALGDGPAPDLVINASTTPRQLIPDTSTFLLRELGLSGVPSHTVHATCLSFLVAMHSASALIEVGAARRVLVVSAERGTVARNWNEPESAALLGDGAAAVVLEKAKDGDASSILAAGFATFPAGAELSELRGLGIHRLPGGPDTEPEDALFTMNGPALYKLARRQVASLLATVTKKATVTVADISLVIPHQASGPALASLSRIGFAADKVVNIIGEYGNCIAASIPMALAHAHHEGRLRRGDLVLLLGTGAGLSVGAMLLRW